MKNEEKQKLFPKEEHQLTNVEGTVETDNHRSATILGIVDRH